MSVSTSQFNELTQLERQYILLTQQGVPIVHCPYQWIAEQLGIEEDEVLDMTNNLLERGVIRRIAAVPNHYRLGYQHNGMTVWDVKDAVAKQFGEVIGKLPYVSHCYLRPRQLPNWNYNLFAMVHGKTEQDIEVYRQEILSLLKNVLEDRTGTACKYPAYDMLVSTQILKKTGLRLKKENKIKGNGHV